MFDSKKIANTLTNSKLKYISCDRRTFLKGALAAGGALALAGCGETVTNTVTVTENKTVTVTDKQTVTVTENKTVTVTESAPSVPTPDETPTLMTRKAHVLPEYTHCAGCNICSMTCAIQHSGTTDLDYANILVYGIDYKGGMIDIPSLCMMCGDAPCKAACPEKIQAITTDPTFGFLIIDYDKCTLCGLCIDACNEKRTGTLRFSRDGERVAGHCDLCGLNPQCVMVCPEQCLILDPTGRSLDGKFWARKPEDIAHDVWHLLYRA